VKRENSPKDAIVWELNPSFKPNQNQIQKRYTALHWLVWYRMRRVLNPLIFNQHITKMSLKKGFWLINNQHLNSWNFKRFNNHSGNRIAFYENVIFIQFIEI
jgi:hypothetical protein